MNLLQRIGLALTGEVKRATPAARTPHTSTYQSGIPLINYEWSAEKAVTEGMRKSGWLYVAVTKKARALASVPLIVERQTRKGWTPDPKHPAQKLLSRPNPHMDMQGMVERWTQHMELAGNAVWHVIRAGNGEALELWPILPDHISPIPDRVDYLRGYEYRPTPTDRLTLKPSEVIHWQYQDPANPYWGLAPIRAAAQTIDSDIDLIRWNRSLAVNGARPTGVVSLSDQLTEEQWEAARVMIQSQTGGAGNARQFLAFGGATKVDSFGFAPTDMDFLDGRRLNREEIFSVIGVPAILAVQGEGATYANMGDAGRQFWTDTLIPLLDDLCRTLGASLLAPYGGNYRIRADLSNVPALRENTQLQAQTALTLIRAGYDAVSVGEMLGLPLKTAAQVEAETQAQLAAQTLKGLTGPAAAWVSDRIGRDVKALSPPDALRVAQALGSGEPELMLRGLEWREEDAD